MGLLCLDDKVIKISPQAGYMVRFLGYSKSMSARLHY